MKTPKFKPSRRFRFSKQWLAFSILGLTFVTTLIGGYFFYRNQQLQYLSQAKQLTDTSQQLQERQFTVGELQAQLASVSAAFDQLRSEDQFLRNEKLQTDIKEIEVTLQQAVAAYDDLIKLRNDLDLTQSYDASFSGILVALSKRNYGLAKGAITKLKAQIDQKQAELASAGGGAVPANVPVANTPPDSGYRRQTVQTPDAGSFVVDIVTADLNSTRVVVETASGGDCADNCPVDSLSSFVSRAGGFAGINGPYFCPAEYPSCAGKTNSFDTLLMNKNKVYFNSANNVYSTVPAIIFSGNSARVVGASQEWGRDTGVDSVIASQPLLVSGGEVRFGGDGDPKKGSRGSRSFIGTTGSKVYIGVVRNATVAEVARVLKTMGVQQALNLDSGGSTALINGGRYLAGPGRNTPFGIVLVRK